MAGMLQMRRSRGAASGFLLVLLGLWGALIPFIGPYFHYAYTPDTAWTYNTARLWLEILPGAAVFLGGILLIVATGRHVALFGAVLAAAAGAWFALGTSPQPAVEQPRDPGRVAGQHYRVHADHGAARLLLRAGRGHRIRRGRGVRPDHVGGLRDPGRRDRSALLRRSGRPRSERTVPAKTVMPTHFLISQCPTSPSVRARKPTRPRATGHEPIGGDHEDRRVVRGQRGGTIIGWHETNPCRRCRR